MKMELTTRLDLETALNALEDKLPQLVADNPDPNAFWHAFCEVTDSIEAAVSDKEDLLSSRADIQRCSAGTGSRSRKCPVNWRPPT